MNKKKTPWPGPRYSSSCLFNTTFFWQFFLFFFRIFFSWLSEKTPLFSISAFSFLLFPFFVLFIFIALPFFLPSFLPSFLFFSFLFAFFWKGLIVLAKLCCILFSIPCTREKKVPSELNHFCIFFFCRIRTEHAGWGEARPGLKKTKRWATFLFLRSYLQAPPWLRFSETV